MALAEIILGFLNVMNWIVDICFFFVTPTLLKLFAFSLFIVNITKIKNKWIKIPIMIVYLLYTILKITQIKDWVISGNVAEFMSVVPFFCMLLLPAIAKNTPIGQYLLNYYAICIYYCIFNAIWLVRTPTDGNLTFTMIFALAMFVIGQIFQYFGDQKP